MIVQSHQGYLDLLPALPSDLPFGEVEGLCARGGFELNISWDKGKLTGLEIKSKMGGICKIRYKNQAISIDTKAGKVYRVSGELKAL
ncbi:glycoside hydrolase family 95-like protein [Pedobacter fastidiosus]